MQALNKAVFLDKDGTLIVDVPYNVNPDLIALSNHCLSGLLKLQKADYLLVVVTNQSGVAQGYFKEEELIAVEQRLADLLGVAGITLNGFYYCPHHPGGIVQPTAIECDCRKPAPGLLLKAAKELNIDLHSSWMVGDILNDVEAGNRAGCKSVLINNGNETEWKINNMRHPHITVNSIDQAAEKILDTDAEQLARL